MWERRYFPFAMPQVCNKTDKLTISVEESGASVTEPSKEITEDRDLLRNLYDNRSFKKEKAERGGGGSC